MLVIETTNVIWKYMKKYKQMVKLVKEEVIILEPGEKYLQEALEIAMDYDISIYDSLFLAQARNLLVTSDKRQGDVARKIGVEIVYI